MFLLPYRIETLLQEVPWANWLFMALCVGIWFGAEYGLVPFEVVEGMVLTGWNPLGLVGHIFLHADLVHLAGNMLCLWVFGNAVCGNIGNRVYLLAFPLCGVIGGIFHLLIDGAPAVGASGAVNGVVGFTLAMYPSNRVGVFWFFLVRGGTFHCSSWLLVLFWVIADIWGATRANAAIAYWAHLGGMVAGLASGLILLRAGWVQLTQWDNPSLLDLISGSRPPGSRT